MDVVKEDIQKVDVTEEDARDRVRWRRMICCGDSYRKQLKEDDDYNIELFYFI